MAEWNDPERRRLPGFDFGLELILEGMAHAACHLYGAVARFFAAVAERIFD